MLTQLGVSCWQWHCPARAIGKATGVVWTPSEKLSHVLRCFLGLFFFFPILLWASPQLRYSFPLWRNSMAWCPWACPNLLCPLCVGNGMGSISCRTSLCLSSLPQLYKWMMAQERALAWVVLLANNCFTWLFATPVSLRSAEMWFISGEKILPQLFWF